LLETFIENVDDAEIQADLADLQANYVEQVAALHANYQRRLEQILNYRQHAQDKINQIGAEQSINQES